MILNDTQKAMLRAKAAALVLLEEYGWADYTETVILSTEEPAAVTEAFRILADDPAYTIHYRQSRAPLLTLVDVSPAEYVEADLTDTDEWEYLATTARRRYNKIRVAYRKQIEAVAGK